jgi:hypothetical protein
LQRVRFAHVCLAHLFISQAHCVAESLRASSSLEASAAAAAERIEALQQERVALLDQLREAQARSEPDHSTRQRAERLEAQLDTRAKNLADAVAERNAAQRAAGIAAEETLHHIRVVRDSHLFSWLSSAVANNHHLTRRILGDQDVAQPC